MGSPRPDGDSLKRRTTPRHSIQIPRRGAASESAPPSSPPPPPLDTHASAPIEADDPSISERFPLTRAAKQPRARAPRPPSVKFTTHKHAPAHYKTRPEALPSPVPRTRRGPRSRSSAEHAHPGPPGLTQELVSWLTPDSSSSSCSSSPLFSVLSSSTKLRCRLRVTRLRRLRRVRAKPLRALRG